MHASGVAFFFTSSHLPSKLRACSSILVLPLIQQTCKQSLDLFWACAVDFVVKTSGVVADGCDALQATASYKQLAYEGYCHLPEIQSKEWYWTQKGEQRGPYSVVELFNMAEGEHVSPPLVTDVPCTALHQLAAQGACAAAGVWL